MSDELKVRSVSELATEARDLLEGNYPDIAVEGEIGQVSRPASGHLYFSIKDDNAQIACAMFRREAMRGGKQIAQGKQVQLRGRISLYVPRGNFQLIVNSVQPAGLGALHQAFERLRATLEREGLFDPAAKRVPPKFPARIAVITSASGAAVRDVRSVLERRYPAGEVLVVPAVVQGDQAVPSLLRALDIVAATDAIDVLLLVRGGGSLEDLWAFNDERLARRLHAFPIPVITGVGHETDFTIADFVADLRAPTPTAAAELATPDTAELLRKLASHERRLERAIAHALQDRAQRLDHLQALLVHRGPERQIADRRDRVERLLAYSQAALSARIQTARERLSQRHAQLTKAHPQHRLNTARQTLVHVHRQLFQTIRGRVFNTGTRLAPLSGQRLKRALETQISQGNNRLRQAEYRLHAGIKARQEKETSNLRRHMALLHAVSPLQTLSRGYAIAKTSEGGVVRSVSSLTPGQSLQLLLRDGEAGCRVEEVTPRDDPLSKA